MTTDPGPGESSATRLLDGAIAFQRDVFPARPGGLALGQSPHTLFIACADGRVSVLDEATGRFVPAAEALAGVLARATDRAAGHAAPAHDPEAPDTEPLPAPAVYDAGPDTTAPDSTGQDAQR